MIIRTVVRITPPIWVMCEIKYIGISYYSNNIPEDNFYLQQSLLHIICNINMFFTLPNNLCKLKREVISPKRYVLGAKFPGEAFCPKMAWCFLWHVNVTLLQHSSQFTISLYYHTVTTSFIISTSTQKDHSPNYYSPFGV